MHAHHRRQLSFCGSECWCRGRGSQQAAFRSPASVRRRSSSTRRSRWTRGSTSLALRTRLLRQACDVSPVTGTIRPCYDTVDATRESAHPLPHSLSVGRPDRRIRTTPAMARTYERLPHVTPTALPLQPVRTGAAWSRFRLQEIASAVRTSARRSVTETRPARSITVGRASAHSRRGLNRRAIRALRRAPRPSRASVSRVPPTVLVFGDAAC